MYGLQRANKRFERKSGTGPKRHHFYTTDVYTANDEESRRRLYYLFTGGVNEFCRGRRRPETTTHIGPRDSDQFFRNVSATKLISRTKKLN